MAEYCPACDKKTLEIEKTEDDVIIKCTDCGYEFD